MTIELELEDWAWLCDFLNETLKLSDDKYGQEDLGYLINILEEAENSILS